MEALISLLVLDGSSSSEEISPHPELWQEGLKACRELVQIFFTYEHGHTYAGSDSIICNGILSQQPERILALVQYAELLRKWHDPKHPKPAGYLFHCVAHYLKAHGDRYDTELVAKFQSAYAQLPPEIFQAEDAREVTRKLADPYLRWTILGRL